MPGGVACLAGRLGKPPRSLKTFCTPNPGMPLPPSDPTKTSRDISQGSTVKMLTPILLREQKKFRNNLDVPK